MNKIKKIISSINVAIFLFLYSNMALAAPPTPINPTTGAAGKFGAFLNNMGTMFANSKDSMIGVMDLIAAFGYLGGVAFAILGVQHLIKHSGNGARGGELKQGLWMIAVAGFLLNLNVFYNVALGTLGAQEKVTARTMSAILTDGTGSTGGSYGAQYADAITGVLYYVKLIGLLAFVRGIMQLNHHAKEKDGAFGKALTHIFGGALAMNIEWTIGVFTTTLGYDIAGLLGVTPIP